MPLHFATFRLGRNSGNSLSQNRLIRNDKRLRAHLGNHRESRHLHAYDQNGEGRFPSSSCISTTRPRERMFVLSVRRSQRKEHEILVGPNIGLTVIDASAKAFVSLTARAAIFSDITKAKELWTETDRMWWEGPEDPNLGIIRANLLAGEIWDGPAFRAVEVFEFLKFRLTGQEPNLGQNRKVTVQFGDKATS